MSPAPEGLSPSAGERFEKALKEAAKGRWAGAADDFDILAGEGVVVADRNAGLCRLWYADLARASASLRRYIAKIGPIEEAVDLEALCQLVTPSSPDDLAELVELSWPLRDREGLLKNLRDRRDIVDLGPESEDDEDPESPRFDVFGLLERDFDDAKPIETVADLTRIVARIRVGTETAALETVNDGLLNAASERFRAIAGTSIPPAHPKTHLLGKIERHIQALLVQSYLPAKLDSATAERLAREDNERILREVWPKTPMPCFRNRTAEQAAKAGDAETQLRAALMLMAWESGTDLPTVADDLHRALQVPAEPEIDPNSVDIARSPLARLSLVPLNRLDDARLVALYRRTLEHGLFATLHASLLEIVNRADLFRNGVVKHVEIYSLLASLAMTRRDKDEAYSWLERGRREESPTKRAKNVARWDMLQIQIRTASNLPRRGFRNSPSCLTPTPRTRSETKSSSSACSKWD